MTWEHWPDDFVVECDAGMTLRELNRALSPAGQWIPHRSPSVWPCEDHTIRQLLDENLPHLLEADGGSWRDWLVGATIDFDVLTGIRAGARVVKSVAGFDIHRALVGSFGEIGTFRRAILRTFAKPPTETESRSERTVREIWVHRVLPSDFATAQDAGGSAILCADGATGTFWLDSMPQRWPGDWLLHAADDRWEIVDGPAIQKELAERLRHQISCLIMSAEGR